MIRLRVAKCFIVNRCCHVSCGTIKHKVSTVFYPPIEPVILKATERQVGLRIFSTSGVLLDVKNTFGNDKSHLSSDLQTIAPTVSSLQPKSTIDKDAAFQTFLEAGDTGGHIIFASDDGINPLLTEIRFSRDAVLYNHPYVWFRDHCRCTACVDNSYGSKVTAEELDPDIEPILDQTTTLGSSVTIRWKDGHFSKYPANWIWANRFGGKISHDILDSRKFEKWDARNISSTIRRFDYASILDDDKTLFEWLYEIKMKGIAVIENVPEQKQQVHKLGARVGFLRRCHFGLSIDETVQHTSEENPSLQTDYPYLSSPPSVHLLHCVSVSAGECMTGVKLQFSDGFNVSEVIREDDPESLEILSKVEWEYFDIEESENGESHYRARHPVIRKDPHGNVLQVVFSDGQRGPKLRIPADFVPQAYKMLKKFMEVAGNKENIYDYTMKSGEIITRDNYRILQRRRTVTQKDNEVQLQGAFIEWDDIYSKLRVLFTKQHSNVL